MGLITMTLDVIGRSSNTNSWTLQRNHLKPHSGVSFLFPTESEMRVSVCEYLRGKVQRDVGNRLYVVTIAYLFNRTFNFHHLVLTAA